MSEDLGPKPDARIEPAEPNPGGADAIDADREEDHRIPDLPTDKNPAVDDEATPDEVQQTEDTATAGTEASGAAGDTADNDPGEAPA